MTTSAGNVKSALLASSQPAFALAPLEAIVHVVRNGEDFGTYQATGAAPTVTFTDTPVLAKRSYYRVEVEGPQTPYPEIPNSMKLSGNMVALSNPVFFNFDPNF